MRLLRPLIICTLLLVLYSEGMVHASEKWQGVDETVVKKIAGEHGREAKKSGLDTGEGDMPLFVFLLAGAIGGFTAGYFWRVLLEGKKKGSEGDTNISLG